MELLDLFIQCSAGKTTPSDVRLSFQALVQNTSHVHSKLATGWRGSHSPTCSHRLNDNPIPEDAERVKEQILYLSKYRLGSGER